MAFSESQIETINQQASAKEGKIYVGIDGKKYVGLPTGRLKLIDKFESKLRDDVNSNDVDIKSLDERVTNNESELLLKEYTTDVDKKLSSLECKLLAMNIVLG